LKPVISSLDNHLLSHYQIIEFFRYSDGKKIPLQITQYLLKLILK